MIAGKKLNDAWCAKNPDKAKLLDDGLARKVPPDLLSKIPEFPKDAKLATRKAGGEALQPIAQAMPLLMSGAPICTDRQ
jgi:Transketolase